MRQRRSSVEVHLEGVTIGGSAPIAVQSMTDTDTSDVSSTTEQVIQLTEAGSELVRLTVNSLSAARAIPRIFERLQQQHTSVPLVGDFHFNGHTLLHQVPECAQALAKYRINPGNVGFGESHDTNFLKMIEIACRYDRPVRIGGNWGSLDPALLQQLLEENRHSPSPKPEQEVMEEALIRSVIDSAKLAEDHGLPPNRIVMSAKVSGVQPLLRVYRQLASRCLYPLHLGLTEAGPGLAGIVASTSALSVLLEEGIGDTIRVSITPTPGCDRVQEVVVAREILQSIGLRCFSPQLTACPGCGRTNPLLFREMVEHVRKVIDERKGAWIRKYPQVASMRIAVMGCIVNGPGESRHADIGISLPGSGESPTAVVYINGRLATRLQTQDIPSRFVEMVQTYLEDRYSKEDANNSRQA